MTFFQEQQSMTQVSTMLLGEILRQHQHDLLSEWMQLQMESTASRRDLISDSELRQQSRDFLTALSHAVSSGDRIESSSWTPVREMLSRFSESRARQGFSASETATFVFSLKQPLFTKLQAGIEDAAVLAREVWAASLLLDKLGLYTSEVYQKSRDEIIMRQQHEMLELSTPVVTLFEGVLALPLIGTLDSARTQIVMENLLQRIVETGSSIAILDITGVPTVDTLVAQHLLKTVAAARLMGADCIISGIRPQIAQTIVHLGVELNSVTTKATLADAFNAALRRRGLAVTKGSPAAPGSPQPSNTV
jgi:rsbT co-antagonist protein RsbR